MFRLIAAIALLAASACTLPPPTITLSGPAPVELPFRVAADGLVVLRGRVNGLQDVDFILDTGAPVTVLIDNARTRALGLDTTGARKLGPADEPASPVGVIRGGFHIAFGPVAMAELTAVVVPGSSLPCPERFDAVGFEGVMGADLLRRFVVEVDWQRRVVRLHEPDEWNAPAGWLVVPLTFRAGHPYVEATIRHSDGRDVPVLLHLDTGMNMGLTLAAGTGTPFAMPLEGKPRPSCFVSGRSEAREGAPVDLSLGSARLAGVTPVFAPLEGSSSMRRTGAVGAGVLSRRPLVIDYQRKQILIGRPSADKGS